MENKQYTKEAANPKSGSGFFRAVFRVLLPLVILTLGGLAAWQVKESAPEAKRKKPVKKVPLVDVAPLAQASLPVMIEALGKVIPAEELTLKSRVAGEVVRVHPDFLEGGIIQKGEEILALDPTDYELAVLSKQRDLVTAQYQLKLEMGHQAVAEHEWEILKDTVPADPLDEELALRKPHLEKARADIAAAKAQLEKARLDLARTRVTAPFNAVIRDRSVTKGTQVAALASLAELAGTDSFWVRVLVPVDRLEWIQVPQKPGDEGAVVQIIYANGNIRQGKVIRLLSDLEDEGRMARLLVEVADPMNRAPGAPDRPPLLLGETVEVEITGREITGVYPIPRLALRDGPAIWLATPDNQLHIQPVRPVWRGPETVYIQNSLEPGWRLIVSDLPSAVEGMDLRIVGEKKPEEDAKKPREDSSKPGQGQKVKHGK